MSLKNIAIIGYGSQAKTWSLNLKESGINVLIILRKGAPRLKELSLMDSEQCHTRKLSIILILLKKSLTLPY